MTSVVSSDLNLLLVNVPCDVSSYLNLVPLSVSPNSVVIIVLSDQ